MTRIRHYGDRLGDGVRAATTRAERLPGVAPGRRGVQAIAASPLRSPLINGPIGLGIVVLILALSGPGSATSFTLMTILVYAIAALGLNIPEDSAAPCRSVREPRSQSARTQLAH